MTVFDVGSGFFDSTWYLQQNPDVAQALQAYGVEPHAGARQHFWQYGLAEGRAPHAVYADATGQLIDSDLLERYVLHTHNQDVRAAVALYSGTPVEQTLTSEQSALIAQHFFQYGFHESRAGGIADIDLSHIHNRFDRLADQYQQQLLREQQADAQVQQLASKWIQGLKLDLSPSSYDQRWQVDEVGSALEQHIDAVDKVVRASSNATIVIEEALNADTMDFARAGLERDLVLLQRQLKTYKDHYPTVIQLRQKFDAHQKLVTSTETALRQAHAELAKWAVLHPDEPKVLITIDQLPPDVRNASPELKVAISTLYRLIQKEPAAIKAIDQSVVRALKEEGFSPYQYKDGVYTPISWTGLIQQGSLPAGVVLVTQMRQGGDRLEPASQAKILGNDDGVTPLYQLAKVNGAGPNLTQLDDYTFDVALQSDQSQLGHLMYKINLNQGALTSSKQALKAFDQTDQDYQQALLAQQQWDEAVQQWQDEQQQSQLFTEDFVDTGYAVVGVGDGVATGQLEAEQKTGADLFVYSGQALMVQHFDGSDAMYFGTLVEQAHWLEPTTDLSAGPLGGSLGVLDMFVLQQGADTVLLIETVAFAGQSSNPISPHNPDFVILQLSGVNAEQLHFADGWLKLIE